ncbi:BamA/TamA family outer membrane protein [Aggregicoccus sp. 17bor-14]|uniref:BamA/TamA family outer membrane protein n=1 Tax=Myxococcaceae TaxID=31 RepID=UPI00129C90AF|nr:MULTISPECIES: BamA/TamA family outer membrane protein [Myxococcaceae]MBF5045172.1 BamA/TamA family outer membrane protein [Simulacricoccus sp. 17bor-14]MRI90913.1 BamA/TamA family outer membrane protein [Aggregicoccus sp. 17bor-14]
MNRRLLPLLLLSLPAFAQAPDAGTAAPPAAEAPAAPDAGTPPEAAAPACIEPADEELAEVLAPAELSVGGQTREVTRLELHGLERLPEADVRRLAYLPAQGPLSAEAARAGLLRLARTGLFRHIQPRLQVSEGGEAVLQVQLQEQPYVKRVHFTGMREVAPHELLRDMFPSPPDEDDDDGETTVHVRSSPRGGVQVTTRERCPAPVPPRALLARYENDDLRPGLAWGGIPRALERALATLRHEGYLLASLEAELRPDGLLEVTVDEGRIEDVEVRGVAPEMVPRVKDALGLKSGDVFLRSTSRSAAQRVEAQLPFLELRDVERKARPQVRFREEAAAGGTTRYRPVELTPEERERAPEEHEVELSLGALSDWWNDEVRRGHEEGITTEGRKVVVHLRPRRPEVDLGLLPVHTQVTGFAPGLSGSVTVWDPKDRAHLTLDAALFIPLRLGGQKVPGDPDQTSEQRRLNVLGGVKARVSRLHLAEVGVQAHDFIDTQDRWRLGDFDSWFYSALINRPDREYFRRTGFAVFATEQLGKGLYAGLEYRRDAQGSLVSMDPPLSLFDRDDGPFVNTPALEGRMASVVARLEYASDAPEVQRVGSLFRRPEVSLLKQDWPKEVALRSLLTLEVGVPGLGGDSQFEFWKLVSDNTLYLPVNDDQDGLRVRARGAGGHDLPAQKQEGLGGWNALRGYDFKELRGDTSLLFSAEYQWGFFGIFTDVGMVHAPAAGWSDAKLGLGASLHLGDEVEFSAAWRTDERAEAAPTVRLLWVRTF